MGHTASPYLGRAALRYVNFTAQGAIEAGGSAVLGHEPRYVRCGCTGFWKRSGHAMLMNFVTYDDRGRLVPHVSRIAGAYASSLLVETMMPGRYDTWRAMRGGNGQMYFGGLFNMLREFGPEMKRGLRRLRPGR